MKMCGTCRVSKPPEEFYRNKAHRGGLSNQCRACFRVANAASKKKNWERTSRERAKYSASHREQINARAREWRLKRQALFPGVRNQNAMDRYYSEHPNSPCVYVIRADSGHVKIGHTINLPVRLAMLQCGSPVLLSVLCILPFQTKIEASAAESALRRRFQSCRVHGEWFMPGKKMTEWLEALPAMSKE
jgi:hypothetical protein